MLHHNRVWGEPVPIDDAAALAGKLTGNVWTPCSAWRYRSLLILNDSFGPGSLQEYAILRADGAGPGWLSGQDVESLTVSWMDAERLATTLTELAEEPKPVSYGAVKVLTHSRGVSCEGCA